MTSAWAQPLMWRCPSLLVVSLLHVAMPFNVSNVILSSAVGPTTDVVMPCTDVAVLYCVTSMLAPRGSVALGHGFNTSSV
jgi:predicted membrane-bound dolichyl-phosphate-mannose-protein mannosyltransferase